VWSRAKGEVHRFTEPEWYRGWLNKPLDGTTGLPLPADAARVALSRQMCTVLLIAGRTDRA
jgi:hypothetical protein